jgi:hypothetical protein
LVALPANSVQCKCDLSTPLAGRNWLHYMCLLFLHELAE